MTDPTRPHDPLAAADALEALTEALVGSLEDEAGDPAAILERRVALLAVPFEASSLDGEARERATAVRARVEALEETALSLLNRRIAEAQSALTALEVGRAATRTYLEQPALQPFLLDRQE